MFTDEELEKLKKSEDYDEEIGYNPRCEYMHRLIGRLEAAENILKSCGDYGPEWDQAWEEWRKASGKVKP